jgi:hypothetical protein
MGARKGKDWEEAARSCRLNAEEIRMAKALGFQSRSLIRNSRPAVEQPPRSSPEPALTADGSDRRDAQHPWPDWPAIPPLRLWTWSGEDEPCFDESLSGLPDLSVPPTADETHDQDALMLRRQFQFRRAAEFLAHAFTSLPEVEKVAAFGSAAKPLRKEVPRFAHFRRHRVPVFHECADLDLAVWVSSFDRLNELRLTLSRTAGSLEFEGGQVAHHQVDLHLFDSVAGAYRGRLCIFGVCPKPGKRECRAPQCGASRFLQQFEGLEFQTGRFQAEPKVLLFDRAAGFLVREPELEPPEPGPENRDPDRDPEDCPF